MTKTNKKGFTIIEVVLVLAIAGLIFLMVFIALPALQRSQRNTCRRQDMARILSAFNDYASNNNGKMPAPSTSNVMSEDKDSTPANSILKDFMDKYVGERTSDQRLDPDGTIYTLKYVGVKNATTKLSSASSFDHVIYYYRKAACDTVEGKVKQGNGENEIAIFYYLEGGAIYCGDNS